MADEPLDAVLARVAASADVPLGQLEAGLARRRARAVASAPLGLALCLGCRRYRIDEAFEGRRTCDECRSRNRTTKRNSRGRVT